ncbi:RSC subunit protein [Saccharomycopsis crataegensis]|uniref:RSC subunit protein n=1 Tax=Saccharomycopsis crataegensis TaxID=43959 RepID=A0AAV5QSB9_9ASCO|nr:RSC subunit protein [Saccharomycopsis crataegensis]
MAKPVGTPFEAPITTLLISLLDGIAELKYQGEDIAYVFKTLPDRKTPEYYKIIQNPISLTIMKTNLRKGRYPHPNDFIRDLAQLVWNAKTYNVKDSQVYNYANVIEQYIKNKIIPRMHTDPKFEKYAPLIPYPDLGPLPEDLPEGQTYTQPKRPPPLLSQQPVVTQPSQTPQMTMAPNVTIPQQATVGMHSPSITNYGNTPVISPHQSSVAYTTKHGSLTPQPPNGYNPDLTYDAWCKRGRPPIIDRPYEQRIKNIMRSLKKVRNERGDFVHLYFDRLPDSKEYPEYYQVITKPISLDVMKIKIRQRSYANVEQFVDDLNTMFANSKTYNSPGSKIVNDTYLLEMRAQEYIKEETSKPDNAFMSSDGSHSLKIPVDHVDVNGKTYKIGDWILVRNPNDENKPIVAQLFRMWETQDGKRWINVCWYYRPEQTVHRVDRLFYPNEVCKSGQYRDHSAEEIVGKCYVAYFTRYQRGDPGVQFEGPLFVCEFRYNDTDKGFNKIRTWKACLPDEVRHIEDPIIPLKSLRVMPKIESPLKHLLPPNANYNDPIPDPALGHPNAPPLIGAVYKRPPDPKDDLGQYSTSMNPNKNNIPKNISNVKNVTNIPLPQNAAGMNGGVVSMNSSYIPGKMAPIPGFTGMPMNGAQSYLPSPPPGGVISNQVPFSPPVPVHHANSSYITLNSNFSYTLPANIDLELEEYNYMRMDDFNYRRRFGPMNRDLAVATANELPVKTEDDPEVNGENQLTENGKPPLPIVWFTSPPVFVSSKIQSTNLLTLSNLVQQSRKRVFPQEENEEDDQGNGELSPKRARDKRAAAKTNAAMGKDHNHGSVNDEEVIDGPGFGFAGIGGINHTAKYLSWKFAKNNKLDQVQF